jgi:hypothetical protein
LNKHYYGSRSCKCHPRDDLGIKYFSSSFDKDFIKDQKEHPEYYQYKIIRICKSRNDAIELEIKLHEKFDVGINENFYNKAKQTSSKFYYAQKGEKNHFYGKKHSEETLKKLSEARKGEKHHSYGKKHTEESRKKMSEALKGKYIGENNHSYGKQHTENTRKKISESQKGEKNHNFKGYYVTPFGIFASSKNNKIKEKNISDVSLRKWCKNNNTIIYKYNYGSSKYLQENFDESIIGKTFADIGFGFDPV